MVVLIEIKRNISFNFLKLLHRTWGGYGLELLLGLMDGIYLVSNVAGNSSWKDCPGMRPGSLRHPERLDMAMTSQVGDARDS